MTKQVAKGSQPGVVLLVEGEPLLAADFLGKLLDRLIPDVEARRQDHEVLDGASATWTEVVDRLRTYSWFGGTRVVEVGDVQRSRDARIEPLLKYLEAPAAGAVLILRADELLSSSKLGKALAGRCETHEFRAPPARELLRWVRAFFKREQLAIAEDAAQRLIEVTEGDLYRLRGELEKLAAAHGGEKGKQIGMPELVELLGDHRAAGVFDLADAILDRRRDQALGLLRRYLRGGGELLPLLGVLQRNVEGALLVARARQRGQPWAAAVSQARLPYPVQARARRWAEQWGMAKLRGALLGLQRIDAELKSGAPQPDLDLAVELLW